MKPLLLLLVVLLTGALASAGLSRCATVPDERIVLVRALEGGPATVAVSQGKATAELQHPLQEATLIDQTLTTGTTTPSALRAAFGALLDALPAPSVVYVVHFGTNQRQLLPQDEGVVTQALQDMAQRPVVEVVVTGHSDTVGSLDENDRLSADRAAVVRDMLLAHGVQPTLLRVVGRGKRELLIQTPDQTDEPANRRVEILLR